MTNRRTFLGLVLGAIAAPLAAAKSVAYGPVLPKIYGCARVNGSVVGLTPWDDIEFIENGKLIEVKRVWRDGKLIWSGRA